METIVDQESWKGRSIIWGCLAGLATIAWISVFYFVEKTYIFQPWVPISATIFYLYAMYQGAGLIRSDQVLPYLRPAFLVFVIANVFYYGYYFVLFKYVDPGLVDLQANDLAARELLEEVGGRDALEITFGTTLLSYFRSLITGFILAVILAFFLRNR